MSDRDASDLFWSFVTGFIIGWVVLGIFRLAWWLLRSLWAILAYLVAVVRGRREGRQIATFEQAKALEAEGQDREAAQMYRILADSGNPVAPMAAYSLGLLLEDQESWDEAEAMYRRAISSRDSELVPLATLGLGDMLYFGRGDANAAEAVYRHLLRPSSQTLDELSARTSFLFATTCGLVHVLHDRGDLGEAQALCSDLVDNDSFSTGDRLSATVGLARILAKQGNRGEAVGLLTRTTCPDEDSLARRRRHRRPLFRAESLAAALDEVGAKEGSLGPPSLRRGTSEPQLRALDDVS